MNTNAHNTRNPIRIAMATVALMAAFAGAARAGDVPQVHVKYADLDVNTVAGATILYRRIHSAAEQVCAIPGTRDLGVLTRVKACTDRAVGEAVAEVNSPALSGVYEVRMGKHPVMMLAAAR